MVTWNRSVPTNTILPHVPYPSVEDAIHWLSATFGFVEHYRYGEPGGAASGAQMYAGQTVFMIHRSHAEKSPQTLTVFVEDIEAHYGRTRDAGARIVEELHKTVYGELQYAAEDLARHKWLFSTHIRDVSPAEFGATVAHAIPKPESVSIAPMLSVRNGARAVEFYKAAFWAEVVFQVAAPDGAVVAELSVAGARFWVADESPENQNFSPESIGGSSARMVLVVDNPDAAFQRALDAGGKQVWPVEDQPYGWRVGRLVDPFGHHWEIGKPMAGTNE